LVLMAHKDLKDLKDLPALTARQAETVLTEPQGATVLTALRAPLPSLLTQTTPRRSALTA